MRRGEAGLRLRPQRAAQGRRHAEASMGRVPRQMRKEGEGCGELRDPYPGIRRLRHLQERHEPPQAQAWAGGHVLIDFCMSIAKRVCVLCGEFAPSPTMQEIVLIKAFKTSLAFPFLSALMREPVYDV